MKKSLISSVVITGMLLTVLGLGSVAVYKVRQAAARAHCSNNMKQLMIALHAFHDVNKHFPVGAVPNEDLPIEKRFGWLPSILPYLESGPPLKIDKSKPWDADEHCPPIWYVEYGEDIERFGAKSGLFQPKVFECPTAVTNVDPQKYPISSNYLGITGVGSDSATLPVGDPRAGFFGYDRKMKLTEFLDGTTTFALLESLDGGPWTSATGTLRAIDPDGPDYLGMSEQFQSGHEKSHIIHAAFANGAVHTFRAPVSREVWDALATVAGNESVALPVWD